MFYLFGSLALLILFLIAIYIRKDLAKQGLFSGVAFMIYGPLSEIIYFQDYWQPQAVLPQLNIAGYTFFFEDFIFAFSIVGVMSIAYDFFFDKSTEEKIFPRQIVLAITLSILCMVSFILGFIFTNINSIFLSMGISIFFASIVIWIRKDLLKTSLVSCLICGFGGIVFYFIILLLPGATDYLVDVWHLSLDEAAFWFLGIPLPITELLWASSMPLYFSIIYKFGAGSGYKNS